MIKQRRRRKVTAARTTINPCPSCGKPNLVGACPTCTLHPPASKFTVKSCAVAGMCVSVYTTDTGVQRAYEHIDISVADPTMPRLDYIILAPDASIGLIIGAPSATPMKFSGVNVIAWVMVRPGAMTIVDSDIQHVAH